MVDLTPQLLERTRANFSPQKQRCTQYLTIQLASLVPLRTTIPLHQGNQCAPSQCLHQQRALPFLEVVKTFPFFPSITTTDPFWLSPQSCDPQTPWSDSLYHPTGPSFAVWVCNAHYTKPITLLLLFMMLHNTTMPIRTLSDACETPTCYANIVWWHYHCVSTQMTQTKTAIWDFFFFFLWKKYLTYHNFVQNCYLWHFK